MRDTHIIDITIDHICDTCRFTHKCVRLGSIQTAAFNIEENALDKWRVDTDVSFIIKSCDLYSADPEKLESIAEFYVNQYMENNDLIDDEGDD